MFKAFMGFFFRIVQNYVIWIALKMMSGALPSSVRDAYGTYREVTTYCNLHFDYGKVLSFDSSILECYRKCPFVKLS